MRLIIPPMIPLADPEDPALWERVEEALRGYGINADDERCRAMTQTPELLDQVLIEVSPGCDAEALINDMAEADRQRENPEAGLVWFLQRIPGEWTECLWAGVRGELGAVAWWSAGADQIGYVPADGLNPDHVDYYVAGGHACPVEPGAELPISRVYDLVREYCLTGAQPTGVQWRAMDA